MICVDANAFDDKKVISAVISAIDEYEIDKSDDFVWYIGDSEVRKTVTKGLKRRDAKLMMRIHINVCNCV